ncbi:adhesion G protein-coupled receptor A3-like isoform X3 [Watersipora subatra]|uniref:adhesion G protein-coupled receptor A3-like isoform X3 n=1 Tax=Watersipora subatra TaxID=2589382 RepID=UPI00355C8EDC
MKTVTVVGLFLLLSAPVDAQSQVCPPGCECPNRPDADKYRVDCSSVDADSLASLNIPSFTTQLSVLANRRLMRIDTNDLLLLTNLDKLNLSGNAIDSIGPNAFASLKKLTKLDLSNNRLAEINESTFTGLENLKRLFLTNNLIQVVARDSFRFLVNIERISLSGNLFSTISEGTFDPLSTLARIDFASKNLQCDCQMKWLVPWMAESNVNIPDTQCEGPGGLAGKLVKNLNQGNMPCDWPVELRVFELQPSHTQLVFAGDSLPINCAASNDNLRSLSWYRQGLRVVTNNTAKIQVDTDFSDRSLRVVTLRLNNLTADKSGTWTCVAEAGAGNRTKSINIVVAPAYCPRVTVETRKGTYTWKRAGFNSRSEQLCKSGENGAKIYYSCDKEGKWVDLDAKACNYDSQITQLLKDLSLADFNITTNLVKVKTLMEMLKQPAPHIADKMDVVFVARVLHKISSSYDLYTRAEIPQMVYNITSLMMNTNSTLLLEAEKAEGSCTSMRKNLQTVVNYILEQHRDYSLYMDNIALHARKITSPESFDGLTCTAYQHYKASKVYFPNNFFCAKQSSSPDLANSKTQKVDAMVHIPAEVSSYAPNQRAFKLVVILYRNDQLYQSIAGHSPTAFVPSSVISANIIGVEVKDLSSTVMIALPRQDYPDSQLPRIPKVQSVFWAGEDSMWRTNGCRISNTVEQTEHNLSIVECNHLSSFSLLQVQLEEPVDIMSTESLSSSYVLLKPQFYVGAVFLSICLLSVIFTYICSYRTINLSRKLKHALINSCFSILFLKTLFVVGIRSESTQCKIIGMGIHYFSITTLFWITVATWNIYRKVSGRGHHHVPTEEEATPLPPNPLLKFYLFAWGIPVIICGITGAVNINLSDNVDPYFCFIDWEPGLAAFYGVVGLCVLGNFFLYVCICMAKPEGHSKGYADEMVVLNADGLLEPQAMDDSISNAGSVKTSIADSEYRPVAQLTGVIMFSILYILMWVSGAVSVVLPVQLDTQQVDIILSFLYMILCIILGIFLVVFYCLTRNDTRTNWYTCCKAADDAAAQPPRSNTNINVISHTNARSSLKGDDDSCSSLQVSSMNNQMNPLMQIMQYHKKASMTHSIACSNSRGDASLHDTADDAPVFFNLRQNGVAKRYWERQRASRDAGLNNSIISVPENSHVSAHSPSSGEPSQHMSIEIQIRSHGSKQAKKHRLGSTNSEPADVRNNIYHSMPKSPHELNIPSHSSQREPTIGQSRTPSEGGSDIKQFQKYPPEMWQSSVPRNYSHMLHGAQHSNGYLRHTPINYEPSRSSLEPLNKQSYMSGYLHSMKDVDNSDEESHYSHRSRRSSQRSRHRHQRHRQHTSGENRQVMPSALNESYVSLQSQGTVRSQQSSRSNRPGHRQRTPKNTMEDEPLLHTPQPVQRKPEEEEKLNINHSSSDNNSSHYACTPLPETKKLNNMPNSQSPDTDELVTLEISVPDGGIYENARNLLAHEQPVYTNLQELRQRATVNAAMSPTPAVTNYELPVYENLFSLNEYDTLKKQKHHVNKGLPLSNQLNTDKDLRPTQDDDSAL